MLPFTVNKDVYIMLYLFVNKSASSAVSRPTASTAKKQISNDMWHARLVSSKNKRIALIRPTTVKSVPVK